MASMLMFLEIGNYETNCIVTHKYALTANKVVFCLQIH